MPISGELDLVAVPVGANAKGTAKIMMDVRDVDDECDVISVLGRDL